MNAPQPSRHAVLSPSSAYKWMACPGSVAMEQKGAYPDSVGINAKAGTFMHHVAAFCLEQSKDAKDYLGHQETVEGEHFTFDDDMAALVQVYLDAVRTEAGEDGELFIEQELDISWITGEEGAVGTADAIIVRDGQLVVIDLKTGHNRVEARENEQLSMYAAAALKAYRDGKLTVRNPAPPVSSDIGDLM